VAETRRVVRAGDTAVAPWNIANLVTVARILLAPLFMWLILIDPNGPLRWLALALFVFGTASDGIDGYLARSRNLGTSLGVLLDPIADKVLIGAGLVVLSMVGELPWWVTIVVLVREFGITVYRMLIVHREIHAASWGGKVKTTAQAIAVSFALAPFPALLGDWMNWFNGFLMIAAVALTVWTGIEYVWKAIRG
jgi:CDP-diacylglycerol--glycerol-3-phosphate 3-phosphatidyltransferase